MQLHLYLLNAIWWNRQLIYHSNTFSEDAPDTEVVSGKHGRGQTCSEKRKEKQRVHFDAIDIGKEYLLSLIKDGGTHVKTLLKCAFVTDRAKQSIQVVPVHCYSGPWKVLQQISRPSVFITAWIRILLVFLSPWGPAVWIPSEGHYPLHTGTSNPVVVTQEHTCHTRIFNK